MTYKAVLTNSLGCDGLLVGLDGLHIGNSHGLLGHEVLGEVAEGRVLSAGQQLVVRHLEGLVGGARQTLLQVVLHDHSRSVRDLRHVDARTCHSLSHFSFVK